MPDNNILFTVKLDDGRTEQWTPEQYEQVKDQFYGKYPTAEVTRTSVYNPEEGIADGDVFNVQLSDGRNETWTADQMRKAGSQLLQKYPDAQVQKASDMTHQYWQQKADDTRQRLASFDAANADFMREYMQRPLQDVRTSLTGMVGPETKAFIEANKDRYNRLMAERNELRRSLFDNPVVKNGYETTAQGAADRRDEYNERARNASDRAEKKDWQRAAKLQDDIRKMYEAPDKADVNGFAQYMDAFNKGQVDKFSDQDFYSLGFSSIARNFDLRDIAEKVQNVTSEEDIDQILTESEKAQLMSFYNLAEAQRERADDIAGAYNAGQTAAESIKFMAEFILSQGLANVAGKALSGSSNAVASWLGKQLMSNQALNRAIQKGVTTASQASKGIQWAERLAVKPVIQGLWHTGTQLSSLETISDGLMKTDNNGDLVSRGQAIGEGLLDSVIENWSESLGGAAEGLIAPKFAGKTPFGRFARWLNETGPAQVLGEAGFNGLLGEIGEEWAGNAVRLGLGLMSPEEFKDFASWEQQLEMAAAFAPMTLFGVGSSAVGAIHSAKQYNELAGKVQDIMQRQGKSEDEINDLLHTTFDTAEDVGKKLAPVLKDISAKAQQQGATEQDKADYKAVMDFARQIGINTVLEEQRRIEQAQKDEALKNEIYNRVGRFWEGSDETPADQQQVRTVTDADGRSYYVTASDANGVTGVDAVTGEHKFLNNGQYTDGETLPMSDYLRQQSEALDKDAEQRRMQQDAMEQINAVRQQVEASGTVPMGTEAEEITANVVASDANGAQLMWTDADGNEHAEVLPWTEIATKLGTPIVVKTDAELEQEAADALEKAQKRADTFNSIPVGTKMIVNLDESGWPVEVKLRKAVMQDGVVLVYAEDETGNVAPYAEDMIANLDEMLEAPVAEQAEQNPFVNGEQVTYVDAAGNTIKGTVIDADNGGGYTTLRLSDGTTANVRTETLELDNSVPRDFSGKALPLRTNRATGEAEVDSDKLWQDDPEAWTEWNDTNPNRDVSSEKKLAFAVSALDSRIAEKTARKEDLALKGGHQDELDAIKADIERDQKRRDLLQSLLDGRVADAERQAIAANVQQAQPQQSAVPVTEKGAKQYTQASARETYEDIYNDEAFRSDEEAYGFIQGKVAKAKAAVDKAEEALKKVQQQNKAGKYETTADFAKARDAAEQKLAAAQQELDYWNDVRGLADADIARAKKAEQLRENEKYEPKTLMELVADAFIGFRNGLNKESFKKETGYSDADLKPFFQLWAKKGQGLTVDGMAHSIAENDTYGLVPTDDNGMKDVAAVKDAILEVFQQAKSPSDLYDYTYNANLARQQAEEEYIASQQEAPVAEVPAEPVTAEQAEEAVAVNEPINIQPQMEAEQPEPSFDRTAPESVEQSQKIISAIVDVAKRIKDKVYRAVIAPITERQKQDFAEQGIDVDDDYVHSIENSAIIHNQNEHGSQSKEAARGQIAIEESDYELIPDILVNYDTVEKSPNKNRQGKDVVIYTKTYPDGTVYYLEEVRDNRKSLAFQTMYKKKSGSGSSDGLMQDSATPSTPIAPSDISVSVSESKDTENSEEASTQQEKVEEAPAEQGTLNFGAEEEQVQQEEPVVEAPINQQEAAEELTEAQKKSLAFVEGKTTEQVEEEHKAKKAEEKRLQSLRDRIAKWKEYVGDIFEVLESIDDVAAIEDAGTREQVLRAMASGQSVEGWYNTRQDKAYIFLPDIKDVKMLDRKVIHEVLAHKGLRALLGEERYNKYLDHVWDNLMDDEARQWGLDYNSHLSNKSETEQRRAAADEFIAHVAENDEAVAKLIDADFWDRLEEFLKNLINDMVGADIFKDATWFHEDLSRSLQQFHTAAMREQEARAADERREDTMSAISGEESKAMATAEAQENPQVPVARSQEKYEDFGEKIGMARKDTATTTGKKGDKDSRPAWMKKYQTINVERVPDAVLEEARRRGIRTNGFVPTEEDIMKGTDYSKPFIAFYEEKSKSRYGMPRRRYITGEDRQPIIFTSQEQYESTLPVFEAKDQGYRVIEKGGKFFIVRPASNNKLVEYAQFNTREEAVAYLASPEGCTDMLNRKRENYELPALEVLTRNNMPDYRKGKDVTPEDILKTFGFRGGEFGNWLNAEERQQFLNYTYDAFMDLAQMLGISPRALSLNGELSIAFGARGQGGSNAAAHYESTRAVINLTKMYGAGSLAHEWAHALDNYFGLMDAKRERIRDEKEGSHNHVFLSEGQSYKRGVRKEVVDAFNEVMKALTRKTVTRKIELDKARELEEKARNSFEYYLKQVRGEYERGLTTYKYNRKTKQREEVKYKPTEEQLAEFDRLTAMLPDDKTFGWQYTPQKNGFRASGEVAEKLYALVKDVMSNRAGQYGPLHNLFYATPRLQTALARLKDAQDGKTETVTVDTDFMEESKWFDRGRASDYWTKDLEMFARALESVLANRMKEQGKSSDYLTYLKAPLYASAWGHVPYPVDDELKVATEAFDKLFNTIQERVDETTGNTVLFSKAEVDEETQKLFDAAKERFGTTRDLREAGYVLPDGSMLDFSGRHQVDGDSSFLDGRRSVDHRDINDLEFERDGNTPTGIKTSMGDFIRRGAIRIHDGSGAAINLSQKPTAEAAAVLRRLIEHNDGDVWVDFGSDATDHYAEYEGAKASRVLNDIARYFDEGYKPEGNVLFSRSSLTTEDGSVVNYESRGVLPAGAEHESIVERTYRKTGAFSFMGKNKIATAGDVAFIFKELETAATENSFVVYVKDGIPTILHTGIGNAYSTAIDTAAFVAGLNDFAPDEVYMVHNHPSGNVRASTEDLRMVDRLQKAADKVPVYGIIIDTVSGEYGQFDADMGSTLIAKRTERDEGDYPIEVHSFDKLVFQEDYRTAIKETTLSNASTVASYLSAHRLGNGSKVAALMVDRYNKVVGNLVLDESAITMDNAAELAGQVANVAIHNAAQHVILYGDFNQDARALQAFKMNMTTKSGSYIDLMDVVRVDGRRTQSLEEGTLKDNPVRFSRAQSANKVAGKEYPDDADLMDEGLRFSLTKNNRKTIEAWMNKRPDLSEGERKAVVEYIDNLDDSKIQLATGKWFAQGKVRLPEDQDKIDQAVSVAGKAKVDPLQYDSPMALLDAHADFKPTEKRINPDDVPTLHRAKEYPEYGIVVYDVDDSAESRKNMRQIINTHFGKDASPWCLLQGNEQGNLTRESAQYWRYYNGYPKQVAFKDGKLLAFSANETSKVQWWNRQDEASDGIPMTMKIPGDTLGRTATYDVDEDGKMGDPYNIFKGNRGNGLYETWFDLGDNSFASRTTWKDGVIVGKRETWYKNGQLKYTMNYNDQGERDGWDEEYYENGQPRVQGMWKNNMRDGQWQSWFENGKRRLLGYYELDRPHGEEIEWYENGKKRKVGTFEHGKPVGEHIMYWENGKVMERVMNSDGGADRSIKSYYSNGVQRTEQQFKDRHADGVWKEWSKEGVLIEENTYVKGREGAHRLWHSNGNMYEEGQYKDNHRYGEWKWYDYNGNLAEISDYDENGYEIENTTFWPNGNKKKYINRRDGIGQQWDEDGNEIRYSKGELKPGEEEVVSDNLRFSRVTDPELLDKLNKGKTFKAYRAMALIDGKLYSPMSTQIRDEQGRWTLRQPTELGEWEQSDEHPEKAIEKNGKWVYTLKKPDGSTVDAAYNPYIHTSLIPLNDQFTAAHKRPELVTVEVEVPESELTSGYKAEKAKDAVGKMTWHSGPVAGQLPEGSKREVVLSRYDKPVRIVPDSEVADKIVEAFKGVETQPFPWNVFTPSLREELAKRGVQFSDKAAGTVSKEDQKAYSENEDIRFSTEGRELLRKAIERIEAVGQEPVLSKKEQQALIESNNKFNNELAGATIDDIKSKKLALGNPSSILKNAGVADKPMVLYGSKLAAKAKSHGFDISEIQDLPMAIANPIAVFNNHNSDNNRAVLTELRTKEGNFLVSIDIGKGNDIDFNIISSLFGKDGKSILHWIEKGFDTYINKKKALNYLRTSAPIADSTNNSELSSEDKDTNVSQNTKLDPEYLAAQIKSADPVTYDDAGNVIPLSERFNPENDDIRFSRANENQRIFVSNAEAAVDAIPMAKATPQQWLKMIESKGGLKAGEDKWIGLSDWLKKQDAKTLTKQDILDYIDQNRIRIEEVQYSDIDLIKAAEDQIRYTVDRGKSLEELQAEIDELAKSEEYAALEDKSEQDWWLIDKMKDVYGDDFELAHYIDDGTLDYNIDPWDLDEWVDTDMNGTKKIHKVRLGYTTDGLENNREIALTVPTIEPWNKEDEIHFGDAGEGRAVAWVRFGDTMTEKGEGDAPIEVKYIGAEPADDAHRQAIDGILLNWNDNASVMRNEDREDQFWSAKSMYENALRDNMDSYTDEARQRAEQTLAALEDIKPEDFDAIYESGKRVLFIDEIQSKRHQEGREQGYQVPIGGETVGKYDTVGGETIAPIYNRDGGIIGRMHQQPDGWWAESSDGRYLSSTRSTEADALSSLVRWYEPKGIPAAPFEKNWHELAMKRMLRLAAEEGYDYVAWTTGEQQAKRYNIGNVVEDVEKRDGKVYIDLKDGSAITLKVQNDGKIYESSGAHIEPGGYNGKYLSDLIGKDLALKVLSSKEDQTFRENDLRIGAEGMKGFYDQILPRFVDKYGKKWGVKTEDIELLGLEDGGITAHALPVTEEMKQSVMEGQLMFSRSARAVEQADEGGIQAVLGRDDANDFAAELFKAMPVELRRAAVDKAMGSNLDIRRSLAKELSDIAYEGYENDEAGILRAAGKVLSYYAGDNLDDATVRYILWRNGQPDDLLTDIQGAALKQRWGVGEAEDVRFSKGETADNVNAADKAAEATVDEAAKALSDGKRDLKDMLTATRAMRLQKEYDKKTIEAVTNLAKQLLKDQYVNEMSRREIARLLGLVRTSAGRSPRIVKRNADAIVEIVIDNLLKKEKAAFDNMIKKTGTKTNATGVEVQGELDVQGQKMLKAFKAALGYEIGKVDDGDDQNTLYGMKAKVQQRLNSRDDAVRAEAEAEDAALTLAIDYKENVKSLLDDESSLKEELKDLDAALKDGNLSKKGYEEAVEATNDAIRANHIDQVEAYRDFSVKMRAVLSQSAEDRAAFLEAEKARINEIHHLANSDMQGKSASKDKRPEFVDKLANSPLISFFTAPLGTFDQMLRLFGEKSISGEGYLWNKFMKDWQKAAENEYLGATDAKGKLDKKVSEVFGEDMKWGDLFRKEVDKDHPKVKVSWWDDGKMVDHELTQGQLLYIYMVNKMADGRMKLRRMGIEESTVNAIVRQMDDRFLTLADWLQNEFLVELRNKYNAVHERLFGASMAAIEDYFPLVINKRDLNRNEDIGLSDDYESLPSTTTGSIIKRRRNSKALDLLNADAFDVVLKHIDQMERWAAFAEFNKDLNALLSYKRFRNQVQNMASVYGSGNALWNNFKDVARIAGNAYHPTVKRNQLDTAAVNVAKGVTSAKISFRVYTALKQMLSLPAFVADASTVNLAKNMAQPKAAWNWAMDNLPLFEKRWKSRIAGDTRLMTTDMDWNFYRKQWYDRLSKAGMLPNAFVDAATVAIGAKSIYDTKYAQYKKDGFSDEQADEKARRDATVLVNETQQSTENAFVSAVQLDRTVFTTMITVFRNSSMGFQRQVHDAIRNLGKRLKPGYREESIAFMKKQLMRDGLTEEQAEAAAERRYGRSTTRDLIRLATFAFLVEFAWNLGSSIVYLLLGDDDDKKKEMLTDAARHALIGGTIEGLSGGNVMSDALDKWAKGESLWNYDPQLLPLFSDIKNVYSKMSSDPVAGWNDVINLFVQAGIGVNPQTLTDAVVAVADACNGDLGLTKEAMLMILRVMQVPQSQLDELYIDELGTTAGKARKMTYGQMAKRYADYKIAREAPLTGWAYSDEARKKREKAKQTTFKKKVNERKK